MMNEKNVSRLFWGVKALLVAVLLYIAVQAVMTPLHLGRALEPYAVSGNERTANSPPVESGTRPPADVSAILENNLFAGANSTARPPATMNDEHVVSSMTSAEEELGLRLVGAIAGGSAASRAIIQNTATKTTRPYKIGDVVASATIESIRPDTVVLLHEGKRSVLRLHTGTAAANGTGSVQEAANPGRPHATGGTVHQPSAKLGYVEDIFRKATIEPYVQDGRTHGLRITGLENTPLAGMFGLKNGDVVQAVNGQQLSNKQKAFQVLQKARTQPKIHIQLLRNGKAKDLSFDL